MAACRFCRAPLSEVFADLGVSPLANSFLREDQLAKMEPFFPLKAWVCGSCMLVQLEEYETPAGIFSDYAYFSSFSTSWLAHAERYVADMIERFGFNERSQVVEIASNDGYLLQYFVRAGVPVLGIEPAANVAEVAVAKGIPSRSVSVGNDHLRIDFGDLPRCRLDCRALLHIIQAENRLSFLHGLVDLDVGFDHAPVRLGQDLGQVVAPQDAAAEVLGAALVGALDEEDLDALLGEADGGRAAGEPAAHDDALELVGAWSGLGGAHWPLSRGRRLGGGL